MKFFRTITSNLLKSAGNNLPSTDQILSAVEVSVALGLSVGLRATSRALSNMNNSNCSDVGFDDLGSVMIETTIQSLVLTLGFVGLIQTQKALNIASSSSIVDAQGAVTLAGLYLILCNADHQLPIFQCSSAYENKEEQTCGFNY